jgi:hypothetical protein
MFTTQASRSRLIKHDFRNNDCPVSVSFSLLYGSSPGVLSATFKRKRSYDQEKNIQDTTIAFMNEIYLGDKITVTCDQSDFNGFVFKREVTTRDSDGSESMEVEAIDWRDILHDLFIFAAFNVIEKNGIIWHILPEDWKDQQKTYITKEQDQVDFDELQDVNTVTGQLKIVARKKLLSFATILNILAKHFNFTWFAGNGELTLLRKSKPVNLDWQSGVNGGQALDDLLDQLGMQWTIKGFNRIKIVKKGLVDNLFFNSFLGGSKSMCEIDGREATRGNEINEDGRNVLLVGENNKHQFIYPCRPDWNHKKFDFAMCYDAGTLSNLLQQHGLSPWSKLKELPPEYHDHEPLEGGQDDFFGGGAMPLKRTRNEMKIFDYISEICFKRYVVDFTCIVNNIPKFAVKKIESATGECASVDIKKLIQPDVNEKDKYGNNLRYVRQITFYPFDNFALGQNGYEQSSYLPFNFESWLSYVSDINNSGNNYIFNMNTPYTISQNLITDSNTQSIAFITSRKVIQGAKFPFEEQLHFVPTNTGYSLDVHEIIDAKQDRMFRKVSLVFQSPMFIIDDLKEWRDPGKYKPDKILVMLSLDKDIYTYERGSKTGVKVRTQKTSIKNLYRAFVNEKEVKVLARNFLKDMKKGSGGDALASIPALAIDISKKIADQLLFHLTVSRTGKMMFRHKASHELDGTIDSINIDFDDKNGLTERINFGSALEISNTQMLDLSVFRVSRVIKTDSKINRERLEAAGNAVIQHSRNAVLTGMTSDNMFEAYRRDATINALEAVMCGSSINRDVIQTDGKFPDDGNNENENEVKDLDIGDVIILDKP